jgi:hypothetical protein
MKQLQKHIGLILLGSVLTLTTFGQAASITGTWTIEDKEKSKQVEIFQATDGFYYGKIVNDEATPSKNGTIILKKLRYSERNHTYTGEMRPPDINMNLDVSIVFEATNRLKLTTRKLLMSKVMYLTRLK